ncbi:hypothetical protein [Bremerella cremea]|nr:hypothetical protein [Bremerella cremea]
MTKKSRRYQLQWIESSRRWRKEYQGKQYYFPLEDGETKASSYRRCLQAWEAKKVEVDAKAGQADPGSREEYLINFLLGLQDVHRKNEDPTRYLAVAETLKLLHAAILQHVDLPLDEDGNVIEPDEDWEVRKQRQIREQAHRFQEQLQTDLRAKVGGKVEPVAKPWESDAEDTADYTLSAQLDKFQMAHPKVNKYRLKQYKDWADLTADVRSLNGDHCREFFNHLTQLVASGEKSAKYCKDVLATFKQFIRYLCRDAELIDHEPKNLESLRISAPAQEIQTFKISELKKYLKLADERLELYLLLMMNCGVTQADIASLTHEHVDWRKGRIIRRRSKTKDSVGNVPTVNYRLWPRTLKLLRQFRSKDEKLVLLTERGTPVATTSVAGESRNDSIRLAFKRMRESKGLTGLPLKFIRKTSSTLIAKQFGEDTATLFLGDAPTSVAQRHYLAVEDTRLDEPLKWLRKQYGI